MTIVENQYLGQIRQVSKDVAKPTNIYLWTLGYLFGNAIYMLTLGIKSVVAYFIWNLLMPSSQLPMTTAESTFAIVAILSLVTYKYAKPSLMESVFDFTFKTATILGISFLLSYN